MPFRWPVVAVAVTLAITPSAAPRHRILSSRLGPVHTGLFVANADGSGERALRPATGLDYSPSLSADATWIVFSQVTDNQWEDALVAWAPTERP